MLWAFWKIGHLTEEIMEKKEIIFLLVGLCQFWIFGFLWYFHRAKHEDRIALGLSGAVSAFLAIPLIFSVLGYLDLQVISEASLSMVCMMFNSGVTYMIFSKLLRAFGKRKEKE